MCPHGVIHGTLGAALGILPIRLRAPCRTLFDMKADLRVEGTTAVFRFHDGPGGGPVDTGIVIRPGDAVTVSATGTILPGAFLGVRTSPEGWLGHPPAEDAPVPGAADPAANAHSLVVRVGDAPWFEARSFSEWRARPDQRGVLVLASNAAAWTAGDPTAAWTITVEVVPGSPALG
jgi:hypothetical protein